MRSVHLWAYLKVTKELQVLSEKYERKISEKYKDEIWLRKRKNPKKEFSESSLEKSSI